MEQPKSEKFVQFGRGSLDAVAVPTCANWTMVGICALQSAVKPAARWWPAFWALKNFIRKV